jgi:hypothetical protein
MSLLIQTKNDGVTRITQSHVQIYTSDFTAVVNHLPTMPACSGKKRKCHPFSEHIKIGSEENNRKMPPNASMYI